MNFLAEEDPRAESHEEHHSKMHVAHEHWWDHLWPFMMLAAVFLGLALLMTRTDM